MIRQALATDYAAIRTVLVAAFSKHHEADLVEELRGSGDKLLELVAVHQNTVVGYVGFSKMQSPAGCAGLLPLGVQPDHQKSGFGTELVNHGLKILRERNVAAVFVLGDRRYYQRFGFAKAAPDFQSNWPSPHFQVIRLKDDAPQAGRAIYAEVVEAE